MNALQHENGQLTGLPGLFKAASKWVSGARVSMKNVVRTALCKEGICKNVLTDCPSADLYRSWLDFEACFHFPLQVSACWGPQPESDPCGRHLGKRSQETHRAVPGSGSVNTKVDWSKGNSKQCGMHEFDHLWTLQDFGPNIADPLPLS